MWDNSKFSFQELKVLFGIMKKKLKKFGRLIRIFFILKNNNFSYNNNINNNSKFNKSNNNNNNCINKILL